MKYQDTRIKFTKAMLKNAILDLLSKKNIEDITVKELCEKAEINRSTFYLHYDSPQQLLDQIEDEFIDERISKMDPLFGDKNSIEPLKEIFSEFITEEDGVMVVMYKNHSFMMKIKDIARDRVFESWQREFKGLGEEQFDIVYDFLFAGASEIIAKRVIEAKDISQIPTIAYILNRFGHACNKALSSK